MVFWRHFGDSIRLFLAFDSDKGKIQMAFLQAVVLQSKGTSDYRKTSSKFDVKDIHPIDQMEMHKKTGEMIFSTVTNIAMTLSKL